MPKNDREGWEATTKSKHIRSLRREKWKQVIFEVLTSIVAGSNKLQRMLKMHGHKKNKKMFLALLLSYTKNKSLNSLSTSNL